MSEDPSFGADSASSPRPHTESRPNVIVVLLDDLGFGQLGCFGGLGGRIKTPNLDRLATDGIRYNNFHVAPMCSPTRASLLTGRNHHSVGVGLIMELLSPLPGYDGRISKETAMLPALLAENGYCTWAAGKWHLTPNREINPLGPFDRWPLAQGFDRYYGFMTALTDQYAPALFEDNRYIGEPAAEPGYHLTEDLVDRSLEWISLREALDPDRPFFHYLAPGAMHSPHQVHEDWIRPYEGAFSDGWDVIRKETLEVQIALGIVPADTELPPANPGVPEWSSLSPEEKQLLEREMEVFAGFLTHTDAQIGRLIDGLAERGLLDNTCILVMSDNGASGEGGRLGIADEIFEQNGIPEPVEDKLAAVDRLGGPGICNIYAAGWAMTGNTPNRWYKRQVHEGGTRSPLIVHWPARIAERGGVRSQFHHVVDIYPTILELIDLEMPAKVRGIEQRPLEGVSMAYTLDDASAPTRKDAQYFEMLGHRAYWRDGWKIVATHQSSDFQRSIYGEVLASPTDGDFTADQWELYRLGEDFSEAHDLAHLHPEIVAQLEREWWDDARRFHVLPLDDRFLARARANRSALADPRTLYRFHGPIELTVNGSPNIKGISHQIDCHVELAAPETSGAVLSDGGTTGGYGIYIRDGEVCYVSNYLGKEIEVLRVPLPTDTLDIHIRMRFQLAENSGMSTDNGGTVTLQVNDGAAAMMEVRRTNITRYSQSIDGLRIGSDTHGVWPEVVVPARLQGKIGEVRIERAVVPTTIAEPLPDLLLRSQ